MHDDDDDNFQYNDLLLAILVTSIAVNACVFWRSRRHSRRCPEDENDSSDDDDDNDRQCITCCPTKGIFTTCTIALTRAAILILAVSYNYKNSNPNIINSNSSNVLLPSPQILRTFQGVSSIKVLIYMWTIETVIALYRYWALTSAPHKDGQRTTIPRQPRSTTNMVQISSFPTLGAVLVFHLYMSSGDAATTTTTTGFCHNSTQQLSCITNAKQLIMYYATVNGIISIMVLHFTILSVILLCNLKSVEAKLLMLMPPSSPISSVEEAATAAKQRPPSTLMLVNVITTMPFLLSLSERLSDKGSTMPVYWARVFLELDVLLISMTALIVFGGFLFCKACGGLYPIVEELADRALQCYSSWIPSKDEVDCGDGSGVVDDYEWVKAAPSSPKDEEEGTAAVTNEDILKTKSAVPQTGQSLSSSGWEFI